LKKIIYLILIPLLFISCKNNVEISPKYSNFENDLERKNLFGNVKDYSQYRAIIKVNNGSTEKATLSIKETFTKKGALKKTEYFDTFGELHQLVENFYNSNDEKIKNISISENPYHKLVTLIKRDTIHKLIYQNVTYNDTINTMFINRFEKMDKIVEQLEIKNNDTIIKKYEYKYDKNNRLIKKIQIEKDNKSIRDYTYDKKGNVIKLISGDEWLKFKTITEYDGNNKIIKKTQYTISADLKEHLNSKTEYDNHFNQINEKIFQDGKLNRELKNKYEFDEKGNWIKKTVFLKEVFANSNEFVPIYVETRKIKYWN
jgi:hypothetical protein